MTSTNPDPARLTEAAPRLFEAASLLLDQIYDEDGDCVLCGGYTATGGVSHYVDCNVPYFEETINEIKGD